MALGHLRLSPFEWPVWTLRDFELAYKGWLEINVKDPWQRTRAMSFYIARAYTNDFKSWSDIFQIPGEKIKKKEKVFLRPQTEEEKRQFELAVNGQ